MSAPVAMGFEQDIVDIALERILPTRPLPKRLAYSPKYDQIANSIREIGLVEPPVVSRMSGDAKSYLLLDGHIRIAVLKELEVASVECLVSIDDEAYTYNKRINRLTTVQEHKMILRAIERGVSQETVAKALNLNIKSLRQKYRLLDGICDEAAELLKDRHCPINMFSVLKKMRPLRQVEVAELMIGASNYSVPYAKALLAATPDEQLIQPRREKASTGLSLQQIDRMETEMSQLQRELKQIEDTYAKDNLNLVIARGYISSLLRNERVSTFLAKNYPDLAAELTSITKAV